MGCYIIPFAIGNFLGPLVLGRLFDTVGRKPMIAGTYILSGVLLVVTAFLFKADVWTATTQTAAWCVIFFFASAGASSAYLTVSEIFPMETRALAIAFFYAVGTAIGGITGPLLFGKLIESGEETQRLLGLHPRRVADDRRRGSCRRCWASRPHEATSRTSRSRCRPRRRRRRSPRSRARAAGALGRRGRYSYSPFQQSSTRVPDEDIDEEVAALAGALARRASGAHPRRARPPRQLPPLGPGPLPPRAGDGQARGEIRRTGRGRFAAGGNGTAH